MQKGSLSRRKVSYHALILGKQGALRKGFFLTVLVAAALREYVVTVRISVASAAAATVMPWPCAANSPTEETQSAA